MASACAVYMLSLSMSSCILWYSGEPDPQAITVNPPKGPKVPLHYNVSTAVPEFKLAARQGIDQGNFFMTAVEHYSLTDYVEKEKGTDPFYLDITVKEKAFGGLGVIWTYLTWYLFLGILPGWTEDGLNVEYKMYKYDQAKKTYVTVESKVYDTTRWGISWLGNLPFLWINLLTWSKKDVISLTAQDFVAQVSKAQYVSVYVPARKTKEYGDVVVMADHTVFAGVHALQAVDTVTIVNPDGSRKILDSKKVELIRRSFL